jgi:hypothetical protein
VVRLASRLVAATFAGPADTARALDGLRAARIGREQVSLLLRPGPEGVTPDARQDAGTPSLRSEPALSVAKGQALATSAAWLGGLSTAEARGLGPVTGSEALIGPILGHAQGQVAAALEALGLPGQAARAYEEQLREGRVVVVVAVPDRTVGEQVRRILAHCEAGDLAHYPGRLYGTAYHGAGPGA